MEPAGQRAKNKKKVTCSGKGYTRHKRGNGTQEVGKTPSIITPTSVPVPGCGLAKEKEKKEKMQLKKFTSEWPSEDTINPMDLLEL